MAEDDGKNALDLVCSAYVILRDMTLSPFNLLRVRDMKVMSMNY